MNQIRDGDLYRVIHAFGRTFEIRYGYYEDFEKSTGEPIPIYPNFAEEPAYTEDGRPFVTAMQDQCPFARRKTKGFGFCNDCVYFDSGTDLIGTCLCEHRRKIE